MPTRPRRRRRKIVFPSKIVGWLNVWDVPGSGTQLLLENGVRPRVDWVPYFCILRQDQKTLTCHRSEHEADEMPGLRSLPVVRLDGGKHQFDRRWGYEALESIKENAIQHCTKHCAKMSTERLYHKSKLLEGSFNESLPDLSRFEVEECQTKKRHMLFRKFFHTSYEKLVGDRDHRRGSVPVVPAAVEEDSAMMDTPSTPSRFTNFLIRKGFKSNLKRTKSATKLDRKRAATNPCETDSTFVGNLKRTMSLGRLTRKRTRSKSSDLNRVNATHQHHLSAISSRLKVSQSHESLLTTGSAMQSVDLTASEMEVKPLHRSILHQDHCFQVTTNHGSKYISCRTAEERDKWIQSLKKTANPQQENVRRSESSLKVWVVEAKNVASKKRYYCEICLDKTPCALTSHKTKSEMLFWGEQFEFNNLPPVEFLIVNLYREADKKKKNKDKNTLLGYVKIPVVDISNRQFVERWFSTSSGTVGKGGKENKTDLPLIRLKVRYQTVQILPIDLYQDLIKYLSENYVTVCEVSEPLVNVRDKEDIATTLIHIMQKLNKAKDFLSEVVMSEVLRMDNQHLTFRGNSIATKSMEAHMKLVGEKYLNDTLGDFVRTIIDSDDDCEVDPTRLVNPAMLQRNQTNLRMFCDMVWTKIITSFSFFPSELRDVFTSFRGRCEEVGKGDLSDNLISASIFLRFLCPAILSPSLFHLTQEFPEERGARNLTLIAKTIQTLANFTKFGAKEEYMTFMNDFVEEEWGHMKEFLQKISTVERGDQYTEFDGSIDLGKELSKLHTLLVDTMERATEPCLEKMGALPGILTKVTKDLDDPNVNTRKTPKRRSQHYDNLVNIQAHIDQTTSPTELLRDMLRHCGESPGEMDLLTPPKDSSRQGSFDVGSSRKPATDLNTNDDYVSCRALETTNSEVSNVSVSSQSTSEIHVNQSWNQMVSAAELVNGEYIDLISFMDDDVQNSSMEMDQNMNGSQMSISHTSSGYQSFGYSQSSSPVDSANTDVPSDTSRPSLNANNTPVTPLSFSNPMYRHNHRGIASQAKTSSPILQASSNSSLSSSEEANTVKLCSPVQSERSVPGDPLRRLAPRLSSSSSSESVQDRDRTRHTQSSSAVYTGRKCTLELRASSPLLTQSTHSSLDSGSHSNSHQGNYSNTLGSTPLRNSELSHSVDFSYMGQRHSGGEQLRRTATDSSIAQRSHSPQVFTDHSAPTSPRGHLSPDDSALYRRLSAQNAVHMGIRSVQRRIYEQEKTKQEYESEVSTLKQQLDEAQSRLQQAEDRLHEHESGTQQLVSDWQVRLEESEERMRKQQAEKDDQMKNIIQRLIHVEDELRHEQQEMQKVVVQKTKVIEAQERRIRSLDTANNKLVLALNQLKEHYNSTARNGMIGPVKSKLTTSELGPFKTSSC